MRYLNNDDYNPHLTDAQEMMQEVIDSVDDCISYLCLAVQEIERYTFLKDLKDDIKTILEVAKEKKEELEDGE